MKPTIDLEKLARIDREFFEGRNQPILLEAHGKQSARNTASLQDSMV
jgi:hypothetical protein